MAALTGISSGVINGQNFNLAMSASYNPKVTNIEPINNWGLTNDVKTMPTQAKITLKIITDGTFLVGEVFSGLTGANVVVTTPVVQVILSDAYVTEIGDVDVSEATTEVTFMSYHCTEVPVQ